VLNAICGLRAHVAYLVARMLLIYLWRSTARVVWPPVHAGTLPWKPAGSHAPSDSKVISKQCLCAQVGACSLEDCVQRIECGCCLVRRCYDLLMLQGEGADRTIHQI
jgi:hypothetical protein